MKKQLTDRQESILIFIQQFLLETGYPPTLRQIGKSFGISSTFGVKRHLDALEKKGYLNVESNASRGISIIKDELDTINLTSPNGENLFSKIPVIGRVAAGSPILAMENIEGSVIIDPSFIKKADDAFALRVSGDSMINAGIHEGDLVIVLPGEKGKNGDIVVAMLDDEVTVKTLDTTGNNLRLLPENDKYKPIEIKNKNEFRIIGKVKGVVRWLK